MMNFLLPTRIPRPIARPIGGPVEGAQQPAYPGFGLNPPKLTGGPIINPGMFNFSGASPGVNLNSLMPQTPGIMPARTAPAPMPSPAPTGFTPPPTQFGRPSVLLKSLLRGGGRLGF